MDDYTEAEMAYDMEYADALKEYEDAEAAVIAYEKSMLENDDIENALVVHPVTACNDVTVIDAIDVIATNVIDSIVSINTPNTAIYVGMIAIMHSMHSMH